MTPEQLCEKVAAGFQSAGLYFGHGTETAHDEAAWLVAAVLEVSPQQSLPVTPVSAAQRNKAFELMETRITTRKPLAYILRSAWFCGLEFYVDERVIVPRSPLAELIGEQFSPWLLEPPRHILDLCTGSACIAIACAHAFPEARVDASDISADAIAVAGLNIQNYSLQDRVRLIRADVFDGLPAQTYDLIISNPPYVDADDIASMPPEYRHEPGLALAAGDDGLTIAHKIIAGARARLSENGVLICEVGNSEAALLQVYPDLPFIWPEFVWGGSGVFLLYAKDLYE